MNRFLTAAAIAFAITAPAMTPAMAQNAGGLAGATASQLTINTIPAKGGAKLTVSSETFANGAAIPLANSAYGDNKSPQLSWSKGPAGTVSYVVIMEDPDLGPTRPPFLHWIIGDLTAETTSLPGGLTETPMGAFQTGVRPNQNAYFGPRPPSGAHNYTFQVFALDKRIGLYDGSKLDEVKERIKDHVLASGALQGVYTAPAQ